MNGEPAWILRAAAINWMLGFVDASDLPDANDRYDLGAIDRARYERRLELLPGALSIGRFTTDFVGLSGAQIGEWLLEEAFLGIIQRRPPSRTTPESIPNQPESNDPQDRYGRFLLAIRLRPDEVLMLTGSPDVAQIFSRWGASAPDIHRYPGKPDVSRYGLAIIGRGQAGHKDFEPWAQLVKNAGKHHGPVMLTMPSSNVSGIVDFLWLQRTSIARYVMAWRDHHTIT